MSKLKKRYGIDWQERKLCSAGYLQEMQTKEIQLFEQQDRAIFSSQRFKAYVGGLQSG